MSTEPKAVMKATGADQFLDWSEWKSVYLAGERASKKDVLQNLRALLDGEDGQAQKKIITGVVRRMKAAGFDDNQYMS